MPDGKPARTMTSVFLDFVRVVVDGDLREVSRHLAGTPALATTPSEVGASRLQASAFFFANIAHYLYAGDTALHMAAAAFQRPVAELLIAHGADCRAKNRRGAEPLHYAADANHWAPSAQAETIAYLIAVGADPNAVDNAGVAPLHRAVRTRSLAAVQALLDGGRTRGSQTRWGQPLCTLQFKTPGGEGAVPRARMNNRPASSGCCCSAAQERPTTTGVEETCGRPRPASGSGSC